MSYQVSNALGFLLEILVKVYRDEANLDRNQLLLKTQGLSRDVIMVIP